VSRPGDCRRRACLYMRKTSLTERAGTHQQVGVTDWSSPEYIITRRSGEQTNAAGGVSRVEIRHYSFAIASLAPSSVASVNTIISSVSCKLIDGLTCPH